MKMMYEYVQVTQIFSVARFPPCWTYPISLLMELRCQIKTEGLVWEPEELLQTC